MAKPIIQTIYFTLTIGNYTKSFTFLLIIKLEYYLIILGQLLIKKDKIIINITNNIINFLFSYYIYIKVFLSIMLDELISLIKITSIKTILDIILNKK